MVRQHVSRLITFGPAVVLPAWGWLRLHQPGSFAGLAVAAVLGLAVIPAAIVLVIFLIPHSGAALVPRSWRKRYRRNHGPRETQRSSRIPDLLRRVTFAADRHKCAYCRKRFSVHELQVDHYVPWSQGGLTTPWNTLTLCAPDNRVKSNFYPGVFYRPWPGSDNERMAREIFRAERRARLNPLRLTRAAWALGA